VVLKDVVSRSHSFSNLSQLLGELKNRSVVLYDKTVAIVTSMKHTVEGLSPSARAFVDETATQVQRVVDESGYTVEKLKAEARVVVVRYQALNETTKQELQQAFPIAFKVINNSIVQAMAAGLLGIQQQQNTGNSESN